MVSPPSTVPTPTAKRISAFRNYGSITYLRSLIRSPHLDYARQRKEAWILQSQIIDEEAKIEEDAFSNRGLKKIYIEIGNVTNLMWGSHISKIFTPQEKSVKDQISLTSSLHTRLQGPSLNWLAPFVVRQLIISNPLQRRTHIRKISHGCDNSLSDPIKLENVCDGKERASPNSGLYQQQALRKKNFDEEVFNLNRLREYFVKNGKQSRIQYGIVRKVFHNIMIKNWITFSVRHGWDSYR